MTTILKKAALLFVPATFLLAGCTDFDNGFDVKEYEYSKNFTDTFGEIDPNQDWSMAAKTRASFNLTEIEGNAVVSIYDGNPNASKNVKLLGCSTLQNGVGSFDFYSVKGTNEVYVQVKQANKTKLSNKYALEDGNIYVGEFATRAFSADNACPTTQRTDENATRDYTYFNNTPSTTILAKIKYPSTDGYSNDNNTKSRDGWVTATKNENKVTWDSYNKILTNDSPFTDESVCQFFKVTGSNFTGLTAGSMKSDVSISSVTETMITWNGSKKTFDEWKKAVLDKYGSYPSNYQYNNTDFPFTVESILVSKTENYVTTFSFDWSNVKYKTGAIISEPGDVYTYNGSTNSLSAWQADAANHVNEILAGTYNGPWSNETLKACITTTKCSKDTDGAIYGGLTDDKTWVFKSNTTQLYANVCPKFQYLNNVEKSAAPGWNLATGYSFFGDGNFFAESVSVWDSPKLGKYYDTETMKKMEQGFSITTTENQVIELPYVFGVTAYTNQFGYIYYKESDEANIDPITLKHYVLIEDGRPSKNIYRDTWQNGTAVTGDGNGSLADWFYTYTYTTPAGVTLNVNFNGTNAEKGNDIVCYCSEEVKNGIYSSEETHLSGCHSPAEEYALVASKSIIGTTYRPMFFGENGNATKGSYQWPAGYKIIFWINTLATSTDNGDNLVANHPTSCFESNGGMGGHFNYSIPSLNHRLYHEYQGTITEGKNTSTFGQVQTISWTIDGTTFLAFGDNSGDRDLNDMVFMVKGATPDDRTVKVAPIKWHLNYNKTHDESDGDLFDNYSLNIGASYTNPKKSDNSNLEPQRPGYEFLGWSESPTSTTGSKTINATVASENGKCYYAVWKAIKEDPQPTVQTQSWLFACEDLGGTYDYDFNDVVWEVSQTITTATDNTVTYSDITVTLLASGGILPVEIRYGNTSFGETHQKFGQAAANRYTQVNVGQQMINDPVVIGTIPANNAAMNLETLQNNFSIVVSDNSENSTTKWVVKADKSDNKAPQVIVVPGEWEWPMESKGIDTVYSNFTNWVSNATWGNWTASGYQSSLTTKRK